MIRRYRERRRIQEEEDLTVKISHPRTRIRGVAKKMRRPPRNEYVAFLGIPYAQPPVKDLRFQPPIELPQTPADQPTLPFLADNGSHPCVQMGANKNEYIGSENCLYLNVFIPRKPKRITELLPVLVYIHGGGFFQGANETVDPDEVMREDLVVVVPNYRLGIFGFLNMRTENCLGNAGLKDQVMALTWVQKNIEAFRGDPRNVTICGQSAGGTCVNLHMLSPLSKGLFHKAIVMAGGVYCPWGYGGHAKHVKQLFKHATEKSTEFRNFAVRVLKSENMYALLNLGYFTMNNYRRELHPEKMMVPFSPSVELVEKGAFLPDPVEKLMEEAEPVPTIAGITRQEGYMYFRTHASEVINFMKGETKFVELVKSTIRQNFGWKDPKAVEKRLDNFKLIYFKGLDLLDDGENVIEHEENMPMTKEEQRMKEEKQKNDEEKKERLATLVTDIFFRRFFDNFNIGNLLHEGWPPFYVYEFDYFARQPIIPMPLHDNKPLIVPKAAEHGDDLCFLFHPKLVENLLSRIAQNDLKTIRSDIRSVQTNMRNLWSSFCSTTVIPRSRLKRDANVTWTEHTEKAPNYLYISSKLILLNNKRLNERRWTQLNQICQWESTMPSLEVSPQTPHKQSKEFQQSQPELRPSTTQAPDPECHVFQLSQPIPGPSTSQMPAEEVKKCKVTHL